MSIDPSFLKDFLKSTEKAAIGVFPLLGKNDKKAADKAAVDPMRSELNKLNMTGEIIIGEGEMDKAPMLFIGEKLGSKDGPQIDIAVDPLEGTNFVAKNMPNAISVIAASEKNNLLSAPDTYMEKIAIGSGYPKDIIDLDYPLKKNISNIADSKNTIPEKLTACVLKRPRHQKIIDELNMMNVKIKFISDGDVSAVLETANPNSSVDIYMGIGGAPEGVLSAAGLTCMHGQMQCRMVLDNQKTIDRAKKMGITDIKKKYKIDDMVKGDVIFCATAITDTGELKGVSETEKYFETTSICMHKSQNKIEKFINKYKK